MTASPAFSVVMCNRNHGHLLDRSVGAICGQQPVPELIVVDDGSTDDSLAVLTRLARLHSNLKIVALAENQGVVAAGQEGLAAASGDYVGWFAADDEILPGLVAAAQALIRRHPGIGVVACEVVIEDASGLHPPRAYGFGFPEPVALAPQALRQELADRYLWLPPHGAFVRRDALRAIGGWRREFDFISDWVAVYTLALRHGVALIDRPLAVIRERCDSFGQSGMKAAGRRDRALRHFLAALGQPENGDLRAACRQCPDLLLVPFGWPIIRLAASAPATFDLAAILLARRIRHSLLARWRRVRGRGG